MVNDGYRWFLMRWPLMVNEGSLALLNPWWRSYWPWIDRLYLLSISGLPAAILDITLGPFTNASLFQTAPWCSSKYFPCNLTSTDVSVLAPLIQLTFSLGPPARVHCFALVWLRFTAGSLMLTAADPKTFTWWHTTHMSAVQSSPWLKKSTAQ